MHTKKEILEKIAQRIWDQTAVNAAIAAKAEKRAKKGQDLNIYTLVK